jgi:S1-C subfamily serine protease
MMRTPEFRMRWAVATIASSALCLGISLYPKSEKRWFIDGDYLYEHGSALSAEYLKEHAPEFAQRLKELLPWVVRIEVQHSPTDEAYRSNHGTGILLGGRQVLTAGHVLNENVTGEVSQILVTHSDGRVLHAEVDRQGVQDWALLRILLEEGAAALPTSPIELGSATEGETAIVFGYPAMVGLSAEGGVLPFHKGDAQAGSPVSALSPMLIVNSVLDATAMTLDPIAGFPPVGGMSGGPVLNSRGQVIGVQVSVSKTTDNATGRTLYYRLNAVPSSAVER